MSTGKDSTYVGLDVHKSGINVALIPSGSTEVAQEWQIQNERRAIARLVRKLKGEWGEELGCCYEAGPCGYTLQRQLQSLGVSCAVIAPSLIPAKPGERVKTDRRDARKLAQLFQAGLLTEVRAPSSEEEAYRDLTRAREDAKRDLLSARHRLSKFLLRRGYVFREGRNWTLKHRRWLRSLQFEAAVLQQVFESYLLGIEQLEERLKDLEGHIEQAARSERYAQQVGWLRCLRGVDTLTAMVLLTELHDPSRFASPRALMAYLGLTPGEHSSGERRRRGGITKTGNAHVRRVLVEAAWNYRHRPAVGARLAQRRHGQPAKVIAIAERAQLRLHRRYYRLSEGHRKNPKVVTVAIARELVGVIWALLHHRCAA